MYKHRYCLPVTLLISFVLVTLGSSGPQCAEDLGKYPVRFAVIGDRTGDHVPGIFEQVVAEVERLKPDFAITVGDMIEGYTTDTTVLNTEWREYLSLVEPLSMPLFHTPGNHDITFDQMLAFYERYIGKPYYSFDHRGLHFAVLDNSRWDVIDEFPEEQMQWLAGDLQEHADAVCTFVFFHQPYWYRTIGDKKPDRLHEIFLKYGVDAVFTGHFHVYFCGTFDGIIYTGIGSSGGGTEPSPTGLLYHFAWVTVDNEGIHIAPIKMGGVLPWDDQTVDEMRMANSVEGRAISFPAPAIVKDDLSVPNAAITLQIDNMATDKPFEDTLHWEVPDGWTVEPTTQPFSIPAGGVATAKFMVSCSGKLYPAPTVRTKLPCGPERTVEVDQELVITRRVICHAASSAPVMDGDLSDAIWKDPVWLLLNPDGGKFDIDSAACFFAYDADNLYYAVRCKEARMDSLVAEMTEHDAAVYGEDCFGIMFCPDADRGIGYQIYANPLGTIYDQKITEQTDGYWTGSAVWSGSYEIKTSRGEDYWTLEARVPLDQLGLQADPGDTWRLNFRRKQRRFNSFASWQLPWEYDPDAFGSLVFE